MISSINLTFFSFDHLLVGSLCLWTLDIIIGASCRWKWIFPWKVEKEKGEKKNCVEKIGDKFQMCGEVETKRI